MPYDQIMAAARLTIPATPIAVRHVLEQVFTPARIASLPTDLADRAQLVLAEALNNIVEHAYAEYDGQIDLMIDLSDRGCACKITDRGLPMPFRCLPAGLPPAANSDELPEGGFGWLLIRTLSNDLDYRHTDGCNHLSFRIPAETMAS